MRGKCRVLGTALAAVRGDKPTVQLASHFGVHTNREANAADPWIDSELQEGTTPLVNMMDGRFTRNFRNFHHASITNGDFAGARAILDNRYKLVIDGRGDSGSELFDMRNDQAEEHNLIETQSEVAADLSEQLRAWQESVLESLTGADYQ